MKTLHSMHALVVSLRRIGFLACGLSLLFAGLPRAAAQFVASGPTFLNVYLNDGTSTATGTTSPYTPTDETIQNTTGIGTPLTSYGPSSWLQGGSSANGGANPGFVPANWGPYSFSVGNVSATVNYQQASYYFGSNNVSSSSVASFGTSLQLVNNGAGIAELRMDWVTPYLYTSPAPAWQPNTTYHYGDMVLDANGNTEECVAGTGSGVSGSSQPTWATLAGQTTTDGSGSTMITWECLVEYVPSAFVINFIGSVHKYSAVAGQENFQLNPSGPTTTAYLGWGGDPDFTSYSTFSSATPIASLKSDLDSWFSANSGVFGFDTPGLNFTAYPFGAATPTLTITSGNTVTVSGYMDVFVDPGTATVQIQPALPPELGIAMQGNQPAVYIVTPTGTNMALQTATNVASANWTTVLNGAPTTVTVKGAAYGGLKIPSPPSPSFYRAK